MQAIISRHVSNNVLRSREVVDVSDNKSFPENEIVDEIAKSFNRLFSQLKAEKAEMRRRN